MQPRSVANWFHTISVAMEQWTTQHRAFVVEANFKIQPVEHNDYFSDSLTFLVMAVFPVVPP